MGMLLFKQCIIALSQSEVNKGIDQTHTPSNNHRRCRLSLTAHTTESPLQVLLNEPSQLLIPTSLDSTEEIEQQERSVRKLSRSALCILHELQIVILIELRSNIGETAS